MNDIKLSKKSKFGSVSKELIFEPSLMCGRKGDIQSKTLAKF